MAEEWKPTHPDLAVPVAGKFELRAADPSGIPWDQAPADSHVQEFRFFDARQWGFLRKFGDGRSQIHVRFRATRTKPMTEYVYFFGDHDAAKTIYQELKTAAHPGEVIDRRLRGKVPYRREV